MAKDYLQPWLGARMLPLAWPNVAWLRAVRSQPWQQPLYAIKSPGRMGDLGSQGFLAARGNPTTRDSWPQGLFGWPGFAGHPWQVATKGLATKGLLGG
ncbi:hypothetical protein B296_00057579 [Ensete ventricosum]|uniref:Uncharacterized protein n=1 Tax=Ensete ventricosum TaxID=4639 RepID=A0A426XFW6_ENSVE|nr:hypothetical protein B296_00057579 [Ensete ventricosum]